MTDRHFGDQSQPNRPVDLPHVPKLQPSEDAMPKSRQGQEVMAAVNQGVGVSNEVALELIKLIGQLMVTRDVQTDAWLRRLNSLEHKVDTMSDVSKAVLAKLDALDSAVDAIATFITQEPQSDTADTVSDLNTIGSRVDAAVSKLQGLTTPAPTLALAPEPAPAPAPTSA